MATPRVAILRAPGTNCDQETAFAFQTAGGAPVSFHVNELRQSPDRLREFQILVIPGGFSYGDDVAAGKILATQLRQTLSNALREFRDQEKLILGVCNGFQTLLKAGLILPADEEGPMATLAHNLSGRYEDRWVRLRVTPGNCPFLAGIQQMDVPVAHGEGNFICRKEWILDGLTQAGQVVMRYSGSSYPDNPNGSQGDVAGLTDATGRVLGLMPHPERNVLPTHNPSWPRTGMKSEGDGLALFRNAVGYFQ